MIRDLLDANQIQAGQKLPLRLDRCDLAAIAGEVVEELASIHGERFLLKPEDGVRGIWSADALRRALWNLAVNAIEYGAPDKPVTITVSAPKVARKCQCTTSARCYREKTGPCRSPEPRP
jgi:signal transduction histidine kinase